MGVGWLGKGLALVLGGLGAWFARRPVEKAAMLAVVDQKVNTFIVHMEKELARACKQCDDLADELAAERKRCADEITDLRAEYRAEIDRLMRGPVASYPTITMQPKGKAP